MKLLNFEFWINGELSKIGHHFSNKVIFEIDFIKKCASKLVFFNEKKNDEDSDNFCHRKLTLKVEFWHFLTACH